MKTLLATLTLVAVPLFSYGADQESKSIAEGEYLARAADCMACHTEDSAKPYAGGVKFKLPIGTLYSTNITPDPQQGIGRYSEEEFSRAVREGIAKNGHYLYPAMPYTAYAHFSDDQIHALYTYFTQGVHAINQPNKTSDIPWYLSARWPLRFWNRLNAPKPQSWQPAADKDAEWNRGAWLVNGPGHCGACHSPRGWMMQEKATNARDPEYLSGAVVEGWFAPSLRALPYDAEQTALILKQGHNRTSAITGPMSAVITESTQYLTDADRQAIGRYLATIRTQAVSPSEIDNSGWQDPDKNYLRYCSTCHGGQGEGTPNVLPALQHNLLVTAPDPTSLIRVLAEGAETPLTRGKLSWSMPGYRATLSDQQLADLASYVRGRFGNQQEKVTASQVQQALSH